MRWLAFLSFVLVTSAAVAEPGPTREVRRDQDGAILPPGAVARLGSRLFRDPGARRLYVEDSGRTVACFEDSAVRWWDLQTGRYLRGWASPDHEKVWFSPNARLVARSVPDGVEVRDTWNDRSVKTLRVDDPTRFIAAFSQDNRQLAVAKDDDTELGSYRVRVCDLQTGQEKILHGLELPPARFWFSDGGRVLIVQNKADRVFAWEIGQAGFQWHVDASDLLFDRNGRRFIGAVGAEGKFVLFDAKTGREAPRGDSLGRYASPTDVLDLSSNGASMLTMDKESVATLVWDWRRSLGENQKRRLETVDGYRWSAVAFTPDSRRFVALTDQRLHVFHVATLKRLTPDLPGWGQPHRLERVYWSNSRRVFTAGRTNDQAGSETVVTAWDAVSGRVLEGATAREMDRLRRLNALPHRPEPRTELARPTARDVDGRWLPLSRRHTYSRDRALVAIGRMPLEGGETDSPAELVFGCRERREPDVVTPSVVEVYTGRALVTLPVTNPGEFAFSSDSRSLAVIEPDGVHLYDVLSGREQLVRKVPTYPRSFPNKPCGLGMSFSPDGSRLAVIEYGGSVLVLDVARPRDRRQLTDDEAQQLWTDLASADPKVGWAAVFRLSDDSEKAMALLAERLTPVREPDVRRPLADLNSPDYKVRAAASAKLLALGDSIRPALAAALKSRLDPEPRQRLETLAAAIADNQPPQAIDLRLLRALAVLERVGTKEALAKINELAEGLADARVTFEAKRARRRLAVRNEAGKD